MFVSETLKMSYNKLKFKCKYAFKKMEKKVTALTHDTKTLHFSVSSKAFTHITGNALRIYRAFIASVITRVLCIIIKFITMIFSLGSFFS